MTKIFFSIIVTFFIFVGLFTFAGGVITSGIGLIAHKDSPQRGGIQVPEGIKIYEIPSGSKFAKLIMNNNDIPEIEIEKNGSLTAINENDLVYIYPVVACLKVYEKTANYYRVLNNARAGGYWIAIADLTENKYILLSWIELVRTVKPRMAVSVPQGLNLRDAPSTNGNKITTINSRNIALTPSGNIKGLWAEVTAEEFPDSPCGSGISPIQSWTGWTKLVDDNQTPNFEILTCGD